MVGPTSHPIIHLYIYFYLNTMVMIQHTTHVAVAALFEGQYGVKTRPRDQWLQTVLNILTD